MVVALILVGTLLSGLTTSVHVVGTTQSSQAEALYRQALGAPAVQRPTDVIVVSSKSSTVSDGSFQQLVARLAAQVRTAPGVTHVAADLSAGSQLVSSDQHAALIALRAASDADIKPVVKDVQTANGSGGFAVAVTGDHTVGNDFTTLSASDLKHGELGFGLPISIVILLLVFGAVVAGVMPALMALLSIIVGLGIAALLAQEFSLSVFIVNMTTGMGLALGIDYSLFIISRFREERGHGRGKEAAIRITGATASRAVLLSGSTFVVALLGMFLVPVTVLRSLAAGAVIVGIVSVAAALTLLPAVLSLIGDRVNSLPLPIVGKNLGRSDAAEARIWTAVTSRVMRRPAVSLALAGGFMVLAAVPALGLHIGQSGVTTLPGNLTGEWDDAIAELEASFELADEIQTVVARAHGILSLISLHRNDLSRAEEAADAAARDLARWGPGYLTTWAAWPRALIQEAGGELGQALATMTGAWDTCARLGLALDYPAVGADLVRLALASGDIGRARDASAAVTEVAARNEVPWMTGAALRCQGLIEDDAEILQAAAGACAGGSRPLQLALACEDAGAAFARQGRPDRARPLLDQALGIYERLGAARDLARAEATLREAGIRRGRRGTRGRPQIGWASLTPAEHAVAGLVAEGLSNPQIGERLYISRRTVQTHLAHMFAKLDIATRAQLAADVTRHRGSEPADTADTAGG